MDLCAVAVREPQCRSVVANVALRSAGRNLSRAAPGPRGHATAQLVATPDRAQDLWFIPEGRLYHSTDGGLRFAQLRGHVTIASLAFGRPKSDRDYPTLFAIGARGDLSAIWRSDDAGASWSRINDAEHECHRRRPACLRPRLPRHRRPRSSQWRARTLVGGVSAIVLSSAPAVTANHFRRDARGLTITLPWPLTKCV